MKEETNPRPTTGMTCCSECDQIFQSEEELQDHNRAFHAHEWRRDEIHSSGSEEQYTQSAGNQGAERKGPGSEQKHSVKQRRQQGQKRAAS